MSNTTKQTFMPRTIAKCVADPRVNVKSFDAFLDGSGAPAEIEVTGYTYAFDFVGRVSCNLIDCPAVTSRMIHASTLRRARAAYETLVASLMSDAWRKLNNDMYENVCHGARLYMYGCVPKNGES